MKRRWALAALCFGLAGCCQSTQCDCDVSSAGDVVLLADQDSLRGGFRKAELRAAYAVRYVRPGFGTPVDTVALDLVGGAYPSASISLQALPLGRRAGAATGAFTNYDYRLVLPNARRTYEVSSLDVATGVTRGCCACPINVRRRFVLDGRPVAAEGGAAITTLRR
ncbi:MAG: hypothetical protein M3Y12_10690 [Bacteroidota bacterium]|nr:hypothetical protein [Bacteroidota bacterium]